MQLLTDKTFENEEVRKIISLIKNWLIDGLKEDKFSFSKTITYYEFKNNIYNFLLSIMKLFLENSQYKNDKCTVIIKFMSKEMKGNFFDSEELGNILTINEQVIKDIYNGEIDKFIVLFHELNHFKVKYDIKTGKINEDIVRIIKEKLIRKSSHDPFNEIDSIKSIKSGYTFINDNYYCDNYHLYSEEVYVQIQAIKDFSLMMGALSKNLDNQREINCLVQDEYKDDLEKLLRRYDNHTRDFKSNFYFNSYYLSYMEAFDLLINDNPKWLEYPQIALEYYKDENNIIRKRNIEQLNELLNSSSNPQEIAYINTLIHNLMQTSNNKQI